jgi:lipopolysaccharide heptosyltransferase II
MAKFLIVNPFGIGDVLFTTPVIRAIKTDSGSHRIGYWCNMRAAALFIRHPDVDYVYGFSRGDLKSMLRHSPFTAIGKLLMLLHQVRRERFEVMLDYSLDHRYALIALLLGIKKRIGFNYRGRGRFLTHRIEMSSYQDSHMVEYYLRLLNVTGIRPSDSRLSLPLNDGDTARGRHMLTRLGADMRKPLVGIAGGAGASWGRDAGLKHWPSVKFAQLADRIAGELNAQIVLLGDASERSIAEVITGMMKHRPVDLVGKTSLEELVAVIGCLRCLVTNDGGPLHLAVALGVRTVSIFGPVDEKVYGPYPAAGHAVIHADMECRPCYRNFKMPPCERDRACVRSIGTQEVFEAVRRLLT